MKKYLIVFGICGIFFAGFVSAQVPPTQTEKWSPKYTDASNYKDCKNEKGVWINVPLAGKPKGGKCLKTGETVDKTIEDGACEKLSISYSAKKSEVELKIKNKKYVVIKPNDVSCENGKCTIGKNDKQEKVVCYEDKSFTKKITDSKATDFCVFEEKVDMKIKEIDFPRDKHPEWYCPYSWEGIYPENKDPYNSIGDYFTAKLSDIYTFTPEDDQLTKDCSARMFALSKACLVRTQKASTEIKNLHKKKDDDINKKIKNVWQNKMAKDDSHWDIIKNYKGGFKELCDIVNSNKCNSVFTDDSSAKQEAVIKIRKWLNKPENKKLRKYTKTPLEYAKEIAKNEWTKTPVPASFKDDISKAIIAENSAKLVSKYISRRNMDLNISVSVSQTSSIKVSKYLQVIGDSEEDADDGSKESRLTFFSNKEGDINIIDKIIRLAVRTMGTLAILLLIISGVLMVISQGDENQLAKAKSTFIYTLVGLFVGFLSYIIVRFIIDMLLN